MNERRVLSSVSVSAYCSLGSDESNNSSTHSKSHTNVKYILIGEQKQIANYIELSAHYDELFATQRAHSYLFLPNKKCTICIIISIYIEYVSLVGYI